MMFYYSIYHVPTPVDPDEAVITDNLNRDPDFYRSVYRVDPDGNAIENPK